MRDLFDSMQNETTFDNFSTIYSWTINGTTNSSNPSTLRLIINSVYIVIGTLGIFCNGVVLVFSLQSKQKHNVFMSGLALADLVTALGYLCYGLRSLIVLKMTRFKMAPFQCMLEGIHLTLFEIGEAAGCWMTTFISLDRLIAMVWISYYRNLDKAYIRCITGFVCVYVSIDVVVSWISSSMLEQKRIFPARCGHPQSVPVYYYMWHTIQIIACGYISIILYVCAIIAMKMKQNSVSSVHAAQIRRETVVTKRLAIVILTTVLLQVLPMTVYETNIQNLYFFDVIGPYVLVLYALTPSVNVFVYAIQMPFFQSRAKIIFCSRK